MRKVSKEFPVGRLLTHNALFTQPNDLVSSAERMVEMALMSRREQLRRSLVLPNALRVKSNESVPEKERRMPAVDPFAWAEDFHRWALQRCIWHDRCFGGVASLHDDFCGWAIARNEVPCRREAFEWLLRHAGMFVVDGLVSGLILRQDFEAYSDFSPGT